MDSSARKIIKKTTCIQFDVLVRQLEANPDLARGAPTFGAARVTIDEQWKKIAAKVNSYGPPQRSAMEWKKIWADLKSRTKNKIAENNASIEATGGGPFQCAPLSEIEQIIDRVLLMSKAAAPSGKFLGFRSLQSPAQVRTLPTTHPSIHPRTHTTTHTITHQTTHPITHPTTSPITLPTTSHEIMEISNAIEIDTTPTRQESANIIITPTRQPTQIGVVTPTRATPSSTPSATPNQRICFRKKRNFQEVVGKSAREQAKAAKETAASSKIQAEATKSIAEELKNLVAIATRQTEAFEEFIKIMKNT